MKTILSFFLTIMLAISLSACGCSNNGMTDTQLPSTTILPDILPTLETNIPDPEVNTQMPIYTEGTDSTDSTDLTLPHSTQKEDAK